MRPTGLVVEVGVEETSGKTESGKVGLTYRKVLEFEFRMGF